MRNRDTQRERERERHVRYVGSMIPVDIGCLLAEELSLIAIRCVITQLAQITVVVLIVTAFGFFIDRTVQRVFTYVLYNGATTKPNQTKNQPLDTTISNS
jgi:hypothetical protein